MLASDHIVYFFIICSIYTVYRLGRRWLFTKRHINITFANIDMVKLQCIDDLYSPEVLVEYSFSSNAGKKYVGTDYLRIDSFLKDLLIIITQEKGLPALSSTEGKYVGEELIEHYLLSHKRSILIEYYTKNPSENRAYRSSLANEKLFYSTPSFPWG